jgi:dihydroxy-acid dehydratase
MRRPADISDFAYAILKTHLASTGLPYDSMDGTVIAVVNSWNEIVPGHVGMREIATAVKKGVMHAGGVPLEFNTIAVCDGIAQGHSGMRYSLPSREVIADSIEVMISGHGIFDGMVMIAACDKIVPAMLMAAARLNLPTVFATTGTSRPSTPASEKARLRRSFMHGDINEEQLVMGGLGYYPCAGVCPYYGTANTMLVMCESLGLMRPGDATAVSGTAERLMRSEQSGRLVVDLVKRGVKARDILTGHAFANAVRVLMATGGSANALIHLPSIAAEADIDLKWDEFDMVSKHTPLLCGLTPNGPYSTADFHDAGGVAAVMNALGALVDRSGLNVVGRSWADIASDPESATKRPDVIHAMERPLRPDGGIAILYGSLASSGAIVKTSAVPEEMHVFRGRARVFDSEEACASALADSQVGDGSVIVVRYEGPKGDPGMRELHRLTEAVAAGASRRIALVTDGRFSGASGGLAVGYVCPEAWEGGPLAMVEDGDWILVDIPNRRLELVVEPRVLEDRKARWIRPEKTVGSRFLRSYRDSATSASSGAVIMARSDHEEGEGRADG